MGEREHLETAIAGLEAQRTLMGAEAVEAAVATLRLRLTSLERREALRKYATVAAHTIALEQWRALDRPKEAARVAAKLGG